MNKPFKFSDRLKSFDYAFQGLKTFFLTQHNAWVHCLAALIAIVLSCILHISTTEWLFVILAIGLVFITEMLNTAIEFLCDAITLETHPQIKKTKDVSAAAVLLASVVAAIIGLIIFIPKLISLLSA
jgi:undecaprenol kinase/diacylglycerol kinase (ATP)